MHTVAVVEDDPSVLQGLNRLLSAQGFRVQTFASAELFIDGIANCEAECLILDVHLGGISGIDLRRQLTSLGSNLPVIFMTAVDNEITRQEALKAQTINNAYTTFEEKTKGSIEPGKFADLVVLEQDIMTTPEKSIESMKVLATMVGGKIVYQRQGFNLLAR